MLEAREKGWLVGPLSWAEVERRLSCDWVPVRRFGIQQSGKLCVIDDFFENATNKNSAFAAQKKIDLKTLEHVAWCAITLAEFLWHSGSVCMRLGDGTLLEGALHEGWSRRKGAKTLCNGRRLISRVHTSSTLYPPPLGSLVGKRMGLSARSCPLELRQQLWLSIVFPPYLEDTHGGWHSLWSLF